METIDLTGALAATTFQCDFCDFKTISAAYLRTHRRYNHINVGQIHRCKICFQTFSLPWGLSKHIDELHTIKNQVFKCKTCDHVTTTPRNLKRHEFGHSIPEGTQTCKHCNKEISLKNWQRHFNKYHRFRDPKLFVFNCDKCDYKTYAQRHLNSHKVKNHSDFTMKCQFCSFITPFEVKLQSHNINMHPNLVCKFCKFETNFKDKMKQHDMNHPINCNGCNFHSDSEVTMNIHKIIKHQQLIRCTKCDQYFQVSETYECHIKEKHKIYIHKCDLCEFKSITQKLLRVHLVYVCKRDTQNLTIMQFGCDFCSSVSFNTKYDLARHYKRFHKNHCFKVSEFSKIIRHCKKCEFSTETIKALDLHYIDIHKFRQSKCNSCDFRTFHPTNLQRHYARTKCTKEDQNLKNKTYKCDLCMLGLSSKNKLKNHYKEIHKNIRYCKKCEFFTETMEALDLHYIDIHKCRTTKCNSCNFRTFHPTNLQRHYAKTKCTKEDQNLKIKTYKCDLCMIGLSSKIKLKNHYKEIHKNEIALQKRKKSTHLKENQRLENSYPNEEEAERTEISVIHGNEYLAITHMDENLQIEMITDASETEEAERRESNNITSSEYFEEEDRFLIPKVEEAQSTEVPDDGNMTIKSENSNESPTIYFEEDTLLTPKVETYEELDVTYICPLNSCTYFTKIMNNQVISEHLKLYHNDIDANEIKFIIC